MFNDLIWPKNKIFLKEKCKRRLGDLWRDQSDNLYVANMCFEEFLV